VTVLRAAWRLFRIGVATALACLVLLPTLVLLPKTSRARRNIRRGVYRRWGRALIESLGGRIEIVGELPRETSLFVTNHLSYLDIPLISALVDGVFVAKAEIRGWPLMGWVARIGGTLFVDRASRRDTVRVGREMAEWIDRGYSVVFFPEGTSYDGTEVGAFRSPLLAAAASKSLPVLAGGLAYHAPPDAPPARLSICWWGDAPLLPHVKTLLTLDHFHATLVLAPEPIADDDRKRLAEKLRDQVVALADAAKTRHAH
jgi:1-acyl-sn-glycerol-3-phosphate acyltransferase